MDETLKTLKRIERHLARIAEKLGVEPPAKKPSVAGDVVAVRTVTGGPVTVTESSLVPSQLSDKERDAMRFNER